MPTVNLVILAFYSLQKTSSSYKSTFAAKTDNEIQCKKSLKTWCVLVLTHTRKEALRFRY